MSNETADIPHYFASEDAEQDLEEDPDVVEAASEVATALRSLARDAERSDTANRLRNAARELSAIS